MYTGASKDFDKAIKESAQIACSKIELTLKSGEAYTLTDDDFIEKSLEITKSAFSNDSFSLGGTVSKEISFTLNNQDKRWDNVSFSGAKVKAYCGIYVNGAPEYIPMGTFWLDSAGKPYDTIEITGVDSILKLEKSYAPESITYPASVKQILQDIADKCGIPLSSAEVLNGDYIVQEEPDKTQYTYRDILGFVAVIAGGFATVNRADELQVIQILKEGTSVCDISPSLRASSKTDYPITISGVAYYGQLKNELLGSDEYPLIIENNPLIDNMSEADKEAVLNKIFDLYNGFTYTPYECDFIGDPRFDEGDPIILSNTRDGTVSSYIFSYTFNNGGLETLEAPSCDELDKNFLSANTQKQNNKDYKIETAYNDRGSGGSGEDLTYTHDDYPEYSAPINQVDLTGSGVGTVYKVFAKFTDADGNPLYQIGGTSYKVIVAPAADNVEQGLDVNAGKGAKVIDINSADYIDLSPGTGQYFDVNIDYVLKIYTNDEYNLLSEIFGSYGSASSNFANFWPIFRTITPNRITTKDRGPGVLGTNIDVSIKIDKISFKDSYVYTREMQIAKFIYFLFASTLNNLTFKGIFKNYEDVYHLLTAFRVAADGEDTTPGTDEPEEPTPTDSFSNPIPSITSFTSKIDDNYTIAYNFENSETLSLNITIGENSYTFNIPTAQISGAEAGTITTGTFTLIPTQGENAISDAVDGGVIEYDTSAQTISLTLSGTSSDSVISGYLGNKIKIYPEEEEPVEPATGFVNPIPEITSASAVSESADPVGNCTIRYNYYSGINSIALSLSFRNHQDWKLKSGNYSIDLNSVSSDDPYKLTVEVTPTSDNDLTEAITAINFVFDVDAGTIALSFTYTETPDQSLNNCLAQTVIYTK